MLTFCSTDSFNQTRYYVTTLSKVVKRPVDVSRDNGCEEASVFHIISSILSRRLFMIWKSHLRFYLPVRYIKHPLRVCIPKVRMVRRSIVEHTLVDWICSFVREDAC